MSITSLQPIEIYPNILVYKNIFKDIKKSYKVLIDSLLETEDRVFSPWTQWSYFGSYLNPIVPTFSESDKFGNLKKIKTESKNQENQKNFGIELMENFHLVTEDYIKRHNIEIDLNEESVNESEETVPTWRWTGGTIGKYHTSSEKKKVGMNYHSDYIREQIKSPGYKFVITCTVYFNADYEG